MTAEKSERHMISSRIWHAIELRTWCWDFFSFWAIMQLLRWRLESALQEHQNLQRMEWIICKVIIDWDDKTKIGCHDLSHPYGVSCKGQHGNVSCLVMNREDAQRYALTLLKIWEQTVLIVGMVSAHLSKPDGLNIITLVLWSWQKTTRFQLNAEQGSHTLLISFTSYF
jgi:hypothetical protein